MLINKITTGFVVQVFDTETGKCTAQSFLCGDEDKWEDGDKSVGQPSGMEYFPYQMVQPRDRITSLRRQDILNQKELIQNDLMCVLDGIDDPIMTNVCQVVCDRLGILERKL